MQKKPIIIKLMSLICFIMPCVFYLERAYVEGLSPLKVISVVSTYDDFIIMLSITCIFFALGIRFVRTWSVYSFLILATIILNTGTFLVIERGLYPLNNFLLFTIVTFIISSLFLFRKVQAPFFNPTIRWWEREKRFSLHVPVVINSPVGLLLKGNTLNISASGLYFVGDLISNLEKNIHITLKNEDLSGFQLKGKVVWVSKTSQHHPNGCGIQYSNINLFKKRKLRNTLKNLEYSMSTDTKMM